MADLTSSKIYGNLDVTRDVNILNNLALDGYLSKNVKINLNSQNDFSTVFSSPHLKLTSDNYVNTTGTTSIALSTSPVDNYGVSLMGLRYGTTGAPNFVLKIHNNSVSGIEAIRVIENGDVGINLTNPTVRLDVIDDSISEGFRVRHSNLTQGISIGYNTITANGTNPDQNISINCKGTGTLSVNTDINIPTGKLYKINGVALNVVAGNGLTGGGNLGPTSTVTLGTPSSSTISSTNAVTTTSHTHALDLSGRTLTAGNGLTGGGTLAADRTFTLGTPSSITSSSTNSVTTTSHTHAITGFSLDSHTHGNISNVGAIGTTADLVVTTTTAGVLTTSSRSGIDSRTAFPVTFGTTAGTVCQGNDSRLSDARTPTSHTHGGGDITSAVANATTATNCSRSIIAGSGLTGGGALTADRTVTMGTPLSITTSSTNTVGATDHAHALDLSGRTLTAGNGLTGGGTLAADRTFTLGTPSSITSSSTNSVTTTSHTHAITGFSLDSHTHTSFSNLSITDTLPGVAQTNTNTTTISSSYHYGQLALMDANAYSVSDAGGIMYFGGNYTASAVTTWAAIRGTKENTTSGQYGGNLVFFTRTNGSTLSTGERMRIFSDGHTSIGTSTKSTRLYVYQDQTTMSDNQALVTLHAGGTTTINRGSVLDVLTSRGTGFSDGFIARFRNATYDVLYVQGDNKVGINTSTPVAPLEVEDLGTSSSVLVKITADDANPYGLVIGNDTYSTTDTNGMAFYTGNTGDCNIRAKGTNAYLNIGTDTLTNALTINTSGTSIFNGYVGINIASPETSLHVHPKTNQSTISVKRNSGYSCLVVSEDSVDNWMMIDGKRSVNGPLGLNYYSSGNISLVQGGGNVRIGGYSTSSDEAYEKLDVAGNVKIREENSVKFAGTGASDSKYEICYNATDNSLCFNYIG